MYASLEEWVTRSSCPSSAAPSAANTAGAPPGGDHAEAITRLTALWHSWEALRLQPGTGIAVWLRDHLDHQLPVLLGRGGPFAQCSEEEHIEPRQAGPPSAPRMVGHPRRQQPNSAISPGDGTRAERRTRRRNPGNSTHMRAARAGVPAADACTPARDR